MRRSCSIHLAVLFAALLSPGSAHAQFPGSWFGPLNAGGNVATPARGVWDLSDKWIVEIGAAGEFILSEKFRIDSEHGRFLDKLNGQTVGTRTVDNTETARRELEYTLESGIVRIGPSLAWRLSDAQWAGLIGALAVDASRISSTNPQRAETAYESSTGIGGFSVGGGTGARFVRGGTIWSIRGTYEYERTQRDNLTRTPPLNVGTVLSERNEFREQSSRVTGSLGIGRMAGPVGLSVSVDGGRTWRDVQLTREIEIQQGAVPGFITEFTGESELSKSGAYGAIGGAMGFKGGFSITARGLFGAQSGFTLGGAWAF